METRDGKSAPPTDGLPGSERPAHAHSGHIVQFYENDGFLCEVVTDFAGAGLQAGESVVLIATEPHRQAVARRLRERGFDGEGAAGASRLVLLDARELLATFMVDELPVWDRFASVARGVLAQATAGGRRARIFGEMVDLLWQDGNQRAAIRLEEMWQLVLETDPVPLLCGYSMDNFFKEIHTQDFLRVCDVHTDVRPAEGYWQAHSAGTSLREVARLQQRARALETEVRERHELEVALRKALEREQVAHDAKDQLLAMLGHELRNPLGAIVLALDLLGMQLGDKAARERGVIEREVRLLVRLVDDLLDAARLNHGKIVLKRDPLELSSIVTHAVEIAGPLIESKRHTLTVSMPSPGPFVDADPQRLAQAIGNLVTNAAKYTPPGGALQIAGEEQDGRIIVRVEDDGVGIAADLLPRLFEPFVQGDRGLDRSEGGLGMGLTVARRLIELHDGTITARSGGPGRGSQFIVSLPRSRERDSTSQAQGAQRTSGAGGEKSQPVRFRPS